MPKSFYLRFIKFLMGITLIASVFLFAKWLEVLK